MKAHMRGLKVKQRRIKKQVNSYYGEGKYKEFSVDDSVNPPSILIKCKTFLHMQKIIAACDGQNMANMLS